MGLIFTGFPIAWVLGGLAAIFTAFAIIFEVDFNIVTNVDWYYTSMSVDRVWDVMENWVMVALPMFIFMGRATMTQFSMTSQTRSTLIDV